jgi:hypothetical protein
MSNEATPPALHNIEQEIEINATPDEVFRGIIEQMKSIETNEPGQFLPFQLEEWPGGRWFRDLGDNAGHLWGHVQSIKPPNLIEIYGPMMLSFAVANNLIIRVEETPTGAKVTLRHQCLGQIPEDFGEGLDDGWNRMLSGAKTRAEG